VIIILAKDLRCISHNIMLGKVNLVHSELKFL
jgi:hypothetical protein